MLTERVEIGSLGYHQHGTQEGHSRAQAHLDPPLLPSGPSNAEFPPQPNQVSIFQSDQTQDSYVSSSRPPKVGWILST
jgi:hypothetical protein